MGRHNMRAVVSLSALAEQVGELLGQGYDLVEVSVKQGEGGKGDSFVNNDLKLAPYNYDEFDAVDLDSLPNE